MEEYQHRVNNLYEKLNIKNKKLEISRIKKAMETQEFWEDVSESAAQSKLLKTLEDEVETIEYLKLLLEEKDINTFESEIKKLEFKTYLSGKYDLGGAIFSIHSGQGGTEAMDWAQMLSRMYENYFKSKGWDVSVIDVSRGEEAGIKSITYEVSGSYAYGYLRHEVGVHRLVRLSPFNSDNLRQTSFAMVEVLPLIDNKIDIEIKDEDLKIDTFRASGAGGQHVNKTDSAIRITHIPTNIVVSCQSERSQHKNREKAMKWLMAKLVLVEEEKQKTKTEKLKGEYKVPGWGHQIRSYVLHPYQMVKDVRTNVETSNVNAVLDGDLDVFIDEEVRQLS